MSEQLEINDKDVDRLLDFKGCDNAGGPIYYYQGQLFTGVIRSYFPDGKVQDEVEYMDGHIGGVARKYYPTGQIKEEYYEYFGRMDKHYKKWDEAGDLVIHVLFDDGMRLEQILPEEQ